jgi:class 3 adenylate cyclase
VTICPSCGHEVPAGGKFCSECGAPLAVALAREQRKTVTVLFCDVAGSTALGEATDPEALRALMARYFERMKRIVERHGGSVEKFIGDAVMAVFGVPAVHEDDALRACRAAAEMRDALPELGIRARIGVNTGEVVTGTAERLATGDAVNVAARLEQVAEPGEVLLGAMTQQLVREAVEVGEARLLELKGKGNLVPAYPLVAVAGDAVRRRLDVPIVGRDRERRALADAWQRALSERACHLFTVLGAAGIGKSRLAGEFLSTLDARAVQGRCLSYGEGITYSPVVEIVLQLGQRPSDPRAASVLASLLGESDATVSAEEIAWAFRKLLEEAAPVVCVFDDLHWAEPTLLDLVDHVIDWSREAPILLLCMARPELLDRRAAWGGGKLNATSVLVEPLAPAETDELIERLLGEAALGEDVRRRIRDAADGNPLFVEEMLAVVADSRGNDVVVPPTIQALLAARLDQLDSSERSVLERGAVEGQVFHRGGVEALAGDDDDIARRLMMLVRKELVRPHRATFAGDDAFRFRHLLIRDAAYDALPKAKRAELHERFAAWLSVHADDLLEYDEIAGYHLEQANRYRVELGLLDDRATRLAERAAERLGAAGDRAFARRDTAAASRLLARALALASPELDVRRELALVQALTDVGELTAAVDRANALTERAIAAGDRPAELRGRLARARVAVLTEGVNPADLVELTREALPVFEQAGDEAGLAAAWFGLAMIEHGACRFGPMLQALERAIERSRHAQDVTTEHEADLFLASVYLNGPTPVDEGLRWFAQHEDVIVRVPAVMAFQAGLEAMRGDIDEARRHFIEARERSLELGHRLLATAIAMDGAHIELLAGDPSRAAEISLEGCTELELLSEIGWLSTVAGFAAEALYRLGRDDDAWHWTDVAERAGTADDVITQMVIRQVRAKLRARGGEQNEAERLAREAVALAEPTDMLGAKADAFVDLAEVLAAAERRAEAVDALSSAAVLYAEKGHVVGAAHVESLRAGLGAQ